jgi:hypothetical protein
MAMPGVCVWPPRFAYALMHPRRGASAVLLFSGSIC